MDKCERYENKAVISTLSICCMCDGMWFMRNQRWWLFINKQSV
jgi:hypothetical protein